MQCRSLVSNERKPAKDVGGGQIFWFCSEIGDSSDTTFPLVNFDSLGVI